MKAYEIVYHPHPKVGWFVVAVIPPILMFFFCFVYLCITKQDLFGAVFTLLLTLMGLILAIKISRISQAVVIFEPTGITCINMGSKTYDRFIWQDICFGYYCYSMKGHRHLVLSTGQLDKKTLRRLANYGTTIVQRKGMPGIVVLYIKPDYENQIREFIEAQGIVCSTD